MSAKVRPELVVGMQLHYPDDGDPPYSYELDGRRAQEPAAIAAAPRFNVRHSAKPKRGRAPRQDTDPCWRADAEASAQTAALADTSGTMHQATVACADPSASTQASPISSCSNAISPHPKRRKQTR